MEFNRFYRIIRDKYITNATPVEDLELLEELDSISQEQINYLFRTLSITDSFKEAINKRKSKTNSAIRWIFSRIKKLIFWCFR